MSVRSLRPDRAEKGSAGAPNRRELQRLATRERIYEISIEEFERVGFAEAQIDRIVEKANVARGTFYFHFRTKYHVLLEFQQRTQKTLVDRLADATPPEPVTAFCRWVFDAITEQGDSPTLRRETMAMWVRGDMEIKLPNEALIVYLVDYFAEAAEQGKVRRDIPPERLAVHFLSALFVHFMSEPSEGWDDFVDTTIEIFVRGIQP